MTPAGTSVCLLDFTDFPAGTVITMPANDFRVGDPIVFTEVGTANLDSALTPATTYYVVAETATNITVSATRGGSPITLLADGGTGTANTAGAGNHISATFAEFAAVCQVSNVDLSLTRGEIETTSLPCGVQTQPNGMKFASFKTYQPGYAEGSGSMTVRFTTDNASVANRMIESSMFANQQGARLKVYLNAVADNTGLKPDDTKSLLVEFPVSLLGFSFNLTVADSPTEATVNFRMGGLPKKVLNLTPAAPFVGGTVPPAIP